MNFITDRGKESLGLLQLLLPGRIHPGLAQKKNGLIQERRNGRWDKNKRAGIKSRLVD